VQTTRSFFATSVGNFLTVDPDLIVGRMSARVAELHRSADREQIRSWKREVEILCDAFQQLGHAVRDWSILLEFPLLRLGKRLDAVVLAPGIVFVIEFKIGSAAFLRADLDQVETYALALRDFHAASQKRVIVPILCSELASRSEMTAEPIVDGVTQTITANTETLAYALDCNKDLQGGDHTPITVTQFETSPYRPTPTIIEAARALYAGHTVAEIGRADAAADELTRSIERLTAIVAEAKARKERRICFVTGTPGAGKTLLGLELALKSRVAGGGLPPASLLSGNPPLVHVLVEAVAENAHAYKSVKKQDARREASSAIQGLLGFLREHSEGSPPPEHVLVFDEAQRAWDAEVGLKLLGRSRSEPALFLDIMARVEWACLICLVGPGQEINRGEGGLPLWGEALTQLAGTDIQWEVSASPAALYGGADVGGFGLFNEVPHSMRVRQEPRLHLANAMRSYRSPQQVRWVSELLNGNLHAAAEIASDLAEPPALITRNLADAKAWLKLRRRGGRSAGLLASSGAVRLVADGLPPTPRSNELDAIAHWFLKPFDDYRSAGALETPLSEFGCQGLELDYVGLCWGGDLIWRDGWIGRSMAAPRWREISDPARRRHRINGYRVLLTRARAGSVIYIPSGNAEDLTRSPRELDSIATALSMAGCSQLPESYETQPVSSRNS
jgi:hypothetical protein